MDFIIIIGIIILGMCLSNMEARINNKLEGLRQKILFLQRRIIMLTGEDDAAVEVKFSYRKESSDEQVDK